MTMHDGHRQRMRERFKQGGLDGFAEHEVLELLLFYARARGNVNPLAHELLSRFGSLHGVLEASVEQLCAVEGVGEETATLLSLMVPLFRRYSLSVCETRQRILNRTDAVNYCVSLLSGLTRERFYLISLNADSQVLGARAIADGTLTEVSAYPRLVAQAALEHNAYGVILCHNHPGGSLTPSLDDVRTTLQLKRLLEGMDILLLDHIIVADGAGYSMVQHHDLNNAPSPAVTESPVRAADSSGKLAPLPRKPKKKDGNA